MSIHTEDYAEIVRPAKRLRTDINAEHVSVVSGALEHALADSADRYLRQQSSLLGQVDHAYATPEPSHHAAEREKTDVMSAPGDATVSYGNDSEHLSSAKPSHMLNARIGLSTPLSEVGQGARTCPMKPLPPRNAVEATCKHSHNVLLRATNQTVGEQLLHARLSVEIAQSNTSGKSNATASTVFRNMGPLNLRLKERPKKGFETGVNIRTEVYINQQSKSRKRVKKCFQVPSESSRAPLDNTTVPQYSFCVRLQDNILAPNVKMLHTWPYHGDEHQPELDDYKDYYNIDVDERRDKLLRLHKASWLFPAADNAITELGISWQDILSFYFAPIAKHGDAKIVNLLGRREKLVDAECPLRSTFWIDFAETFAQDMDLVRLVKAAYFCEQFQRVAKLSAWHVLRRCALVRDHFSEDDPTSETYSTVHQEDECRICHRFTCQSHGELRETDPLDDQPAATDAGHDAKRHAMVLESEDETDSEVSSNEDREQRDIVNPQQVNFRKTIDFHGPVKRWQRNSGPDLRKARNYWDNYLKPDDTEPLYPCHHPGATCTTKHCSCKAAGVPCSKYCSCTSTCERKFQGCSCSTTRHRRAGEFVCFRDDRCACYQMGRECDPDLCALCGVCDLLGQINDNGEQSSRGLCHNASLQQGVGKHTILGRSNVHEYGLYACEQIKPHDFIGEYKGEIITKEEANRRGAIYELQKMSYLFSLNKCQEVDSTFFGNKMRFINHSTQHTKNVYAVIMMTNTVHRIAMFADRHIDVGEELFFDYGPTFPTEQVGGKEVRKSVPKARNAKLLESFNKTNKARHTRAQCPKGRKPAAATRYSKRSNENEVEDDTELETNDEGVSDLMSATDESWSDSEADDTERHISAEERLAAYNISDSNAGDTD